MQKPLFPALLFLIALFAFSCGKDNDNTPDSAADQWVISKYWDKNGIPGQVTPNDASGLFSGYRFEFETGNVLLIRTPTGATVQAKWGLTNNDTVMPISMESPTAPLEEIMGVWTVEENTATSIKLKNPSAGGTTVPDFSKQGQRVEFVKL